MKKSGPFTLTALAAVLFGAPGILPSTWSPFELAKNMIVSPAHAAGSTVYNMRVDGMTCPFCAATSEKALKAIPGVTSVSTNLKQGVITVCAAPSAGLTSSKMKNMFAKKGFTFRSMSSGKTC